MNILKDWFQQKIFFFFSLIFVFSFFNFPLPSFSVDSELSPIAEHLSQNFSNSFCGFISQGDTPEVASQQAAKEVVRRFIFSPDMTEITSIPKEEIVLSISSDVFARCGDEMQISSSDLNEYLLSLAERDRQEIEPKPFKPFGIG